MAVVCRHCCGEVCLVTWEAEVRAVAGAAADSVVEDLVAVVVVLEEVSAVVETLVEEARVAVGKIRVNP